ncbi:MAG TPA: hypothetical protein PKJ52_01100 [Rectinema sp.]|nr:hypothetical protein [Rectinema sp.]
MARTVMSLEDKIKSAVEKPLTDTMEEFASWLEDQTGLDIDVDTLKVSQRLYASYIKVPEVAEKIAARKAENAEKREAAKIASEEKVLERLAKLDPATLAAKLKALGIEVVEAE